MQYSLVYVYEANEYETHNKLICYYLFFINNVYRFLLNISIVFLVRVFFEKCENSRQPCNFDVLLLNLTQSSNARTFPLTDHFFRQNTNFPTEEKTRSTKALLMEIEIIFLIICESSVKLLLFFCFELHTHIESKVFESSEHISCTFFTSSQCRSTSIFCKPNRFT